MKRHTIGDEWAGSRIDRFIRAASAGIPFPELQMLFRKGRVTLNGKRTSGSTRLERGDLVEIDIKDDRASGPGGEHSIVDISAVPADLDRFGLIGGPIPIVFEDDAILVIDKPSGLVVQPGNRKERGSLLDILEEYRSRTGGARDDPTGFRYSTVHRLDRETSGLLVVAKTRAASRALSKAFSAGKIEKVYLAVTESPPAADSGRIEIAIKVDKKTSSRSTTGEGGKRALSIYRKLADLAGGRALVEVRIETGRTHQVRVHLSSIGAPVVGDIKYGGVRHSRIILHAWKLRIPHPTDETELELEAPPPSGFGLDV